jgi:hypothetical protein
VIPAHAESRNPDTRLRRTKSDVRESDLRKRHADIAYAGIELEINQERVQNGALPTRDRHAITWALLDALASQHAMGRSDAR